MLTETTQFKIKLQTSSTQNNSDEMKNGVSTILKSYGRNVDQETTFLLADLNKLVFNNSNIDLKTDIYHERNLNKCLFHLVKIPYSRLLSDENYGKAIRKLENFNDQTEKFFNQEKEKKIFNDIQGELLDCSYFFFNHDSNMIKILHSKENKDAYVYEGKINTLECYQASQVLSFKSLGMILQQLLIKLLEKKISVMLKEADAKCDFPVSCLNIFNLPGTSSLKSVQFMCDVAEVFDHLYNQNCKNGMNNYIQYVSQIVTLQKAFKEGCKLSAAIGDPHKLYFEYPHNQLLEASMVEAKEDPQLYAGPHFQLSLITSNFKYPSCVWNGDIINIKACAYLRELLLSDKHRGSLALPDLEIASLYDTYTKDKSKYIDEYKKQDSIKKNPHESVENPNNKKKGKRREASLTENSRRSQQNLL